MTFVQAYARFMCVFLILTTIPDTLRPFTDAAPGGLILWPDAGRTMGIFLVNWVHLVLHYGLAVVAAWAAPSAVRAHGFARAVFWIAGALLVVGLLSPDGFWLVAAQWPDDVAGGRITPLAQPSWFGFVPANPPDDAIDALVAASGFVFGFTSIGPRVLRATRSAKS